MPELESLLFERGVDSIMKEGNENQIFVYTKNVLKTKKKLKYISELTSINLNVFIIKKFSKKNLTNNLKYKL